MGELTHKDLVRRAGKWLRGSAGCSVVMTEFVAYTPSNETPDAVGWIHGNSIMIECKRTRPDFLADAKKSARREGGRAIGSFRFYFAPPGIIRPEEIPSGWGLYEVHDKQVVHAGGIRYANAMRPPLESDRESEVAMLLSAIRRLKISTAVFVVHEDDVTPRVTPQAQGEG